MKNDLKRASSKGQEVLENSNAFRGYTLEELRYHRAMTTLQKELCKGRIMKDLKNLRAGADPKSMAGKGSKIPLVGTIASTVLKSLNYLDYISLGMTLFGAGRKIVSLLPRKKK